MTSAYRRLNLTLSHLKKKIPSRDQSSIPLLIIYGGPQAPNALCLCSFACPYDYSMCRYEDCGNKQHWVRYLFGESEITAKGEGEGCFPNHEKKQIVPRETDRHGMGTSSSALCRFCLLRHRASASWEARLSLGEGPRE
jgi:hypothetical protein